ncbi:MAG: tRNA pseudouridine(55) synthase TruB [Candidatus Hydrogenedentes bacterium]|nr:tRNA pseudouridine(55) synthase TruB [Candidatus Hydrogenedentota bacterium]
MNGILLVDKPAGITSHDVVDRIRRAAGTRRVGHTGTLDPGATGLLVLCLGAATRLSEHLTGLDKVYEGAMRLGIVTDSYDMDGKVVAESPVPALTMGEIQQACDRLTGDLMQVPPMVSAVKVGGERLYKRARQGEVVERAARHVTVREFRVLSYEAPDAQIRVKCTRGTYVRSLCHDVGQALGCGAILASLRRTFVGHFSVEDALPVDQFTGPDHVASRLKPIETALTLPSVTVRSASRGAVISGAAVNPDDLVSGCPVSKGWVQVKSESGRLLALGEVNVGPTGLWIHPKRVFVE